MITVTQFKKAQQRTLDICKRIGVVLTDVEAANIEVVDNGLSDFEHTGLNIITYVNTDRVCAKELILFPNQTCPEHAHPTVGGSLGKEETFRCRSGVVYLYVPGKRTEKPKAVPPKGTEQYYTVWHEIILNPGEQYTLVPNTLHWFQAGDDGTVVSEFSTTSTDEKDIFTNPNIKRKTEIAKE